MEYVDASVISAFFFAQPVVGAALGALFLGEKLGSRFVLGGVVMAAGVSLVATTSGEPAAADSRSTERSGTAEQSVGSD